jgi:DNA (cytosine-5)-methyltransferase 1
MGGNDGEGAGGVTKLRVLDLFSGIGGFSLGLERAVSDGEYTGFETVAFCEIEDFPRRVLAKHWPDVPCYTDVRELTGARLAADGIGVDVICGGFPCQDISFAGLGAGLAGARSGLFYEIARLVSELGPRFVILENVGALLSRGLDAVLGTLASLGYDAEWHCIPASALGAPHRRDRVWIIAYPNLHVGKQLAPVAVNTKAKQSHIWNGEGWFVANAAQLQRDGSEFHGEHSQGEVPQSGTGSRAQFLADTMCGGRPGQGQPVQSGDPAPLITRQAIDAFYGRVAGFWRVEPDVGRVANGIPQRAHRLKALGNAVVPQIPELIGNAILASLASEAKPCI